MGKRCSSPFLFNSLNGVVPRNPLSLHNLVCIAFIIHGVLLCAGDIKINPGPTNTRAGASKDLSDDSNILQEIRTGLKALNSKMDKVLEEITEIKQRVDTLEMSNAELKLENTNLRKLIEDVTINADKSEAQNRRSNLIIHGIPDSKNETWEETESKLKTFLKQDLDIDADDVSFERVHRLPSYAEVRPVIAKLTRYKDKENVLRVWRKKDPKPDIRIAEDFTKRIRTIRTKLVPHMLKAREAGKRASLRYDKLVIDGKTFMYDTNSDEIKECT